MSVRKAWGARDPKRPRLLRKDAPLIFSAAAAGRRSLLLKNEPSRVAAESEIPASL